MKIKIGLIILLLLFTAYFAIAVGEISTSISWKPITLPEKNESKKLLLNPDEHIYNFVGITSPSSTNTAWKGINDNANPASPISRGETELTTDEYGYISYSDDIWANKQGGDATDFPAFRWKFVVTEDPKTVTQIDVSVEGKGGTNGEENDGWTFYIRNWLGGFEQLSETYDNAEITLTGQITSSIASYIDDGGNIELEIVTKGASSGGTGIYLDYAFATITYTVPPTANAQLIMISE